MRALRNLLADLFLPLARIDRIHIEENIVAMVSEFLLQGTRKGATRGVAAVADEDCFSAHERKPSSSLKNRKPRKNHLYIHAGVEACSIAIRDVLVFVTNREGAAVAVDDLDAAAEIEGEVETGGAGYGYLFVEIEEASGGLAE